MVSGVFKAGQKRCVFIHVPRTAGGSLSNLLGVTVFSHVSIKWFPDHYFSFSFVRNPWDRVVSAFFFLNQGGDNLLDKFNSFIYLSKYEGQFTRFVKGELADNSPTIFHQMHFRPQYKYICDESGNVSVDFLGKYENLEEDLGRLFDKLDLSLNRMPHLNQSKHKPYKDYYNESTREIVRRAYRKDIELFNYSF